jgi:hypothetical protein
MFKIKIKKLFYYYILFFLLNYFKNNLIYIMIVNDKLFELFNIYF